MLSPLRLGGGIEAYPIGSIYMSVNATNPKDIFGGTWEALNEGRVLIGANASHPAGQTGGEETHILSVNEMPSHDHSGNLSGSTGSGGGHSHTRGNMNITGELKATILSKNSGSNLGCFSGTPSSGTATGAPSGSNNFWAMPEFDASKSWSGSTSSSGSHSHSLDGASITTSSKGGGQAHNNMPPYLSVYMWKRVA